MTETSVRLPAPAIGGPVAAARHREISTAIWLGGIVLLSAALRFAFAASVPGPGVFPDELIYSELARSVASSGHFLVRDVPFSAWTFSPLYVLLIAPAFLIKSLPDAYLVAKAINCVAISFAAVPTYLLARRVVDRPLALVAASFAVLLPSMAFSSRVMTESAFYPVFLLVVLSVVRALESPTAGRQLVTLAAIAIATGFRVQALVLLPALVTAICLRVALDVRGNRFSTRHVFERAKAYNTTGLVLLACAGLAIATAAIGLGAPSGAISERVTYVSERVAPLEAPRWFVYHLAELDLALGILPFAAALLFVGYGLLGGRGGRRAEAFTIAALATTVWTVALAAAFASQADVARVQERYVFYVEPLVLIAFLGWVQARNSRPARRSRVTIVLLCAAASLPLALPYGTLLGYHAFASTPGLVPWVLVESAAGTAATVVTIALLGFGAVIVLAWSPNRRSLVPAVGAYLVVGMLVVNAAFQTVSSRSIAFGLGSSADRAWIDREVGANGHVVVLWSASGQPWKRFRRVWESEFFNRSVGAVYYMHAPLAYDLPQTRVRLAGSTLITPDGTPLRAEYVLSDGPVIAGDAVAERADVDLTLYRVDGTVRMPSNHGGAG